jgi:hypothetical protein
MATDTGACGHPSRHLLLQVKEKMHLRMTLENGGDEKVT